VVSGAWRELGEEIARWRDGGRTAEFWWRDDDASGPSDPLERLLALAARARVPLALAVVPAGADARLLAGLAPGVAVLQHGADHRNRAAAGEKKNEFPASEPEASAIARLAAARERLGAMAGPRWVAVLAPPWNRLQPGLVAHLAAAGFRGLSRYGARDSPTSSGLRKVNTHVDVIEWQGGRGFAGEEAVLRRAIAHLEAKRHGRADAAEPTGWLTHHERHDEQAWGFLERLFDFAAATPGVRWCAAAKLFVESMAG
jgi:hypothetical protein